MAQQNGTLSDEQKQAVLRWEGDLQTLHIERGHLHAFADAIGDPNPLWTDELAARNSRFGGLIAPPTFLRAARSAIPRIPQLSEYTHILDASSEWEYEEPVRVGDTITADLHVKSAAQRNLDVGPAVLVVFESSYRNQFNRVAVRQRSTLVYYKGAQQASEPYKPLHKHHHTPTPRSGVLYWEDVQEGQELPLLTKQCDSMQLVKYAGASRDFYQIHYDKDFALANKLNGIIVHGALKMAFLGQLVTQWMGEWGTLKKLSVQYRGMDVPGDVLTIKGKVTKKYTEGNRYCINCDMRLENGRDEKTTTGRAVVLLPFREAGLQSVPVAQEPSEKAVD